MKKIIVILAAAAVVVSCGVAGLGRQKAQSPAQKYAQTATTVCEWSKYNGFPNQNLEGFAAASARAKLADRVAALITHAVEIYDANLQVANKALDGKVEDIKTSEGKGQESIRQISKQLVTNSRIAVSDRYVQKDGTEDCYVAVEVTVPAIVEAVEKNEEMKEAISRERKAEIDFNSEQFKAAMRQSFEELKNM